MGANVEVTGLRGFSRRSGGMMGSTALAYGAIAYAGE
jgi:hypothetical protein